MEEPPNPSSVAGLMRLSVKLVLPEVVAEVFAVVSSEVEDLLEKKLSVAVGDFLSGC